MGDNSGEYKYLAKNIGLLTLSSFATKILSFILVPLYTNILTTTEYGINDLFTTTIGILLPIVTINIQEAVLRFSLDNNYNNKDVLAVGLKFVFCGSIVVILGLMINSGLRLYGIFADYAVVFFLRFFSQAVSDLLCCYVRGIDRIAVLSISSIICSIVVISSNIIFLVVFKLGLTGYFLANTLGPIIQSIYIIAKTNVIRDTYPMEKHSVLTKEMLSYSKPLILNSVGWWINNAFDKYVVIYFLGFAENGIYSVAGKIPSILNIVQTIFAQAWTLSAVKDYDSEDSNGFFSNTYAIYNSSMVVGCSALIVFSKLLASVLYAKDFYIAWRYVPWLTIAIVFGSLSGFLGGFFTAAKDSKIFAQSTLMGAICNIALNFAMTPVIGAMGAAIATAISYYIVWLFRYYHSKKYVRMEIKIKRDYLTYILLVIQTIGLLMLEGTKVYCLEIGIFGMILLLYRKDLKIAIEKIVVLVREKRVL